MNLFTLTVISLSILLSALFPTSAMYYVSGQDDNSAAKNEEPLDPSEAIYSSNATAEVLGVKNISETPYRTTEERYLEHGLMKDVGNVTNNQTYFNTYLSDELLTGRGSGTISVADGDEISWTSSDLGRKVGDKWLFYGVILFNSTDSDSLSFLNNGMALSKSSTSPTDFDYIWLLNEK
ncbi:MAG TPA: hypothetical protein VJS91_05500 [Nitrososphaeraceae archaeon]|nr:hypothetical protein [Nitrososphaeraceae archaeon]